MCGICGEDFSDLSEKLKVRHIIRCDIDKIMTQKGKERDPKLSIALN